MVDAIASLSTLITAKPPLAVSEPAAPPGQSPRELAAAVEQPNPSFQFDPSLGLVVIKFRSDSGKVELSIPNLQKLNAYAADPLTASKPSNPVATA
jgi:hypothetical protein